MRQLNKPVQRHTARTNLNGTLNGFVILFFARSLASWLGGTIHLRVMWLLYTAPCSRGRLRLAHAAGMIIV